MENQEKIVWVYPWDLQDEGIETVLDRLQENEITGINVSMLYHSGRFLLPHNPKRKMHFPEPGALYFEPDGGWYETSQIQPPVSKFADNAFWKKLRKETRQRNMKLNGWLLGFHNSQMARAYPEVSVVNAFGDTVEVAVDPAHPQIKPFFADVFKDLAGNFEFDGFLLESFEYMPFRHDYHHEVIGIPMTPAVEFFMALSFSDAMKARAQKENIDIDSVQDFVISICEEHFKNPHEGQSLNWDDIEQAVDGEMKKYLDLRTQLNTEIIAAIHHEVRSVNEKVILSALDFGPLFGMGPNGTEWENGIDLMKWSSYVNEIHPTFYFADENLFKQKVEAYEKVLKQLGERKPKVIPALRAILPQVQTAEDLKIHVKLLEPIENGISFYNYGFMSMQNLKWIKQSFE